MNPHAASNCYYLIVTYLNLSVPESAFKGAKNNNKKNFMAFDFKFPDVGEGISEGEVVKWRVKEGDSVKQDQVLVEVETDKAVVEIPSPREGKILKIHHKEGDTVKVGEVLVSIGEKGEKAPEKAEKPEKEEKKKESFGVVGEIPEEIEETKGLEKMTAKTNGKKLSPGRVEALALPAVRRLARELGVGLEEVQGSGSRGRITEEDVRGAAKAPAGKKEMAKAKVTKKYDMWGYVDRIPVKGIRKATARRMSEAVSSAALVTHMDECDVTRLWEIREKEKGKAKVAGVHLTFMPFILKAAVQALKKHPYLNSSMDKETEEVVLKKYYNIGIAVDLEGGLVVPVVKGVDQKSILQLGKEIQELAEKARKRKIDLADLKGGTFTITNVGVLGGVFATPIPNHPEAAILATGRIQEKPLILEGRIQARRVLPISLTFDHRILDGAEAARFTNTLKKYLEDPEFLLMEK